MVQKMDGWTFPYMHYRSYIFFPCAFILKWMVVMYRDAVAPEIDIWRYHSLDELYHGSRAKLVIAADGSCIFSCSGQLTWAARAFLVAFEGVGSSVLADTAIISACCPDQGHMEANTSFEKEEVVNYEILLIWNGRHERPHPFSCRCKSEVSPLQSHKPNPTTKKDGFAWLNNLPNDRLTTTTVLIWRIINSRCRGGGYPSCDVFNRIKK